MERNDKKTTAQSALYQARDFFLIRAPLFPIEKYEALFSNEGGSPDEWRDETIKRLQAMAEDPVIREAISVASPSLLQALPALADGSQPRKQEQAIRGFLRYLLRMITRPTPFGLFAGVTRGTFGAQMNMTMRELSSHRKVARPDMEWVTRLVLKLEEQQKVRHQLRVRLNPLCERNGSRLEVLFLLHSGGDQGQMISLEKPSIRMTPVVEQVMQLAEQPILFAELLSRLHQMYAEVPFEQIEAYLDQLFTQEFLISELRPPLTAGDPFQHVCQVIERLEGADEWKEQLARVQQLFAAYQQLPIGEGERKLAELKSVMKQLCDTKDLVQVDVALETEQTVLSESIREDVAKAAELLWRLSPAVKGLEFLETFRSDFLQKYDHYREVPLLTLLNADVGLGAPAGYLHPAGSREYRPVVTPHQLKRDALLMEWVGKAFAQGQDEVVLTDERVAQLTEGEADLDQAPLSLELYFAVSAASATAVEQGDYRLVLAPNVGSDKAGKSFGRFLHLFDESFMQQMAEAQAEEHALQPDAVFAEVVYYPHVFRYANVSITAHNRLYEILLGASTGNPASRELPLDDLVVGCTIDSLYLKSKSLNKRVIPTANHMLNQVNMPNLYRFLRDLSMENQRNWSKFQWGALDQMTRLPRLRYGRIVLAPARWKLFAHAEPFRADLSEQEWLDAFKRWREEWGVPRHVSYTLTDNRLLLDLDHPLHVAELRRDFLKLASGDSLLLVEVDKRAQEQILQSASGHYMIECVFPLLRTIPRQSRPIESVHLPIPREERLHLPGSEWMYVKLYGAESRQEELIGRHLRSFCEWARQENLAQKSYFLRYADPEFHLRVRFQGEPGPMAGGLLPQLAQWGRKLQQEGLLTRLVLDTYDPEIERYGGPELMRLAEQLFAADSMLVAEWLAQKRDGHWQLDWDLTAVISVIDLLQQFGLSRDEQLQFFESMDHKRYLQEFRSHRNLYMAMGDFESGALMRHPNGPTMLQHLQQRAQSVQGYACLLRSQQEQQTLTNRFADSMAAVIHLHLNRMLGIDRVREHKIMMLTRHTIQAINAVQRNMNPIL